MADRPHTFTLRSSDDRALASALLAEPTIAGAALDGGLLTVRSPDFGAFSRTVRGNARRAALSPPGPLPPDQSLQ